MSKVIDLSNIGHMYSFESYVKMTENLVAIGYATGENPSEKMIEYTRLNYHRLRRIRKTMKLKKDLIAIVENFETRIDWLVIVESWCGDVPHSLPFIAALSKLSKNIDLKIILRDDNPEIMDQFLTNGSRSIPKLISYNPETFELFGTWGPRPVKAMELVKSVKNNPGKSKMSLYEEIQRWYLTDKGESIQDELTVFIKACCNLPQSNLDYLLIEN